MAEKYGRVPVHLNRCVPIFQVLFNTLYEVPLNAHFIKSNVHEQMRGTLYK